VATAKGRWSAYEPVLMEIIQSYTPHAE